MDQLQFDLSIVKKESQYFEDYGQNGGHLLDNIIPESDFDQFGQGANVPNADELDNGVDWLNSFFDEPPHDTFSINGLNPPISKLSDVPLNINATYPSMVKVLGQVHDQAASLEMLQLSSDHFANDAILKSPSRAVSPDPFLNASESIITRKIVQNKHHIETSTPQIIKRGQSFKLLTQLDKNTLKLATARELIQRLKCETQLQGTAHRVPEQNLGSIHNQTALQRDIKRNIEQFGGKESDSTDNDSGTHSLLSGISRTVPELSSLQNGRPLCYDSPTQRSPVCAPTSPSGFVESKECTNTKAENTTVNEQTQDRQPFYLSEEERRTLITEGLPIPRSYPLSKVEERALKKVRRKIKNKISAQESRRKKKEYLEALEKKIEIMNGDNSDLKKKVDTLENTNKSLLAQLQKLQTLVTKKASRDLTTRSCQTSPNLTNKSC